MRTCLAFGALAIVVFLVGCGSPENKSVLYSRVIGSGTFSGDIRSGAKDFVGALFSTEDYRKIQIFHQDAAGNVSYYHLDSGGIVCWVDYYNRRINPRDQRRVVLTDKLTDRWDRDWGVASSGTSIKKIYGDTFSEDTTIAIPVSVLTRSRDGEAQSIQKAADLLIEWQAQKMDGV